MAHRRSEHAGPDRHHHKHDNHLKSQHEHDLLLHRTFRRRRRNEWSVSRDQCQAAWLCGAAEPRAGTWRRSGHCQLERLARGDAI